jgi:hypothetical protein
MHRPGGVERRADAQGLGMWYNENTQSLGVVWGSGHPSSIWLV